MKKIYLLYIASLLACCFSCTKENEEIPEPPVVTPTPEPEPQPEPIVWRDYIPYYLELVKDSVWPDGKGETFIVKNQTLSACLLKDHFFLEDGVYPGMIVDINPNSTPVMRPVTDVEYHPITFSSIPFINPVTTDHPTETMCTEIKEKVLANTDQINSFSASTSEYHSAKELYMLYAYEGLRLDSIMNGTEYSHHEMNAKNGVLYSFTYTAFTIVMDLPLYEGLLKEDPKDYTSLAYISSISYGVRGCMTIESDSASASVKSAVSKISKGVNLTEAENTLIMNSHIRTALFHSGPGGYFTRTAKPTLDVAKFIIKEYFNPVDIKQWVGILDIHFSDYKEHSVGSGAVRIDAPLSSRE